MYKKLAVVICMFAAQVCAANEYPSKPIKLIVPFSAGGPTDVVARHLAKAMEPDLKQTIIVENRPSAGGIVGMENLLRSPADGYTIMIHNIGMSTVKKLNPQLKFDPRRDFSYIGEVADVPMILVGKKSLPAANFKELRDYIKKNGKAVNISNAGIGTASHLCAMMLMSKMNVTMTMVPYKGAAPALTDLQGGQVDLLCDQITTTLSPIQANRVKAYGSTSASRLALIKNLATLSEQGLEGMRINVWHGLYAPKNTESAVIKRLSDALKAAIENKEFVDSMNKLGAIPVEPARATSESLEKHLGNQVDLWSPLIEKSLNYLH